MSEGALIPGIVQDAETGRVLMLGYLTQEAIDPHPVAEPVTVKATAGRDRDGVGLIQLQLPRPARFAAVIEELEYMAATGQRAPIRKRNRDDPFGSNQSLGLDGNTREQGS